MMDQATSERIPILASPGNGVWVEGWVDAFSTSHPCIVIHRDYTSENDAKRALGLWSVTHRPSGYAYVTCLPNREVAALVAEWLAKQPLLHHGSYEEITSSAGKRFSLQRRLIETCFAPGDQLDCVLEILGLLSEERSAE